MFNEKQPTQYETAKTFRKFSISITVKEFSLWSTLQY